MSRQPPASAATFSSGQVVWSGVDHKLLLSQINLLKVASAVQARTKSARMPELSAIAMHLEAMAEQLPLFGLKTAQEAISAVNRAVIDKLAQDIRDVRYDRLMVREENGGDYFRGWQDKPEWYGYENKRRTMNKIPLQEELY